MIIRSSRMVFTPVLLLLVACQTLPERDMSAIEQLRNTLVQADLDGDAAAVAALCTKDAVWMPPDHPAVTGRSGIQAFEESLAGLGARDLSVTSLGVEGSSTLAVDKGTYSMIDFMNRSRAGKYVMTLRKQPTGKWLVNTAIWNDDEAARE